MPRSGPSLTTESFGAPVLGIRERGYSLCFFGNYCLEEFHVRRRSVLFAIMAAVAASMAVSGCSASSTQASPQDAPTLSSTAVPSTSSAAPSDGLTKGMVLPLEAYMESDQENLALENGHLALESRCMAAFGFTVPNHVTNQVTPPGFDGANMARRYGISDLAQAQQYGYHLATPPPTSSNPANSVGTPALRSVMFGSKPNSSGQSTPLTEYDGKSVPAGGCYAQAGRQIGDANLDADLPNRLDTQSMDRSTADPRVQAALAKWSACMAGKGYHVDSPLNADTLVPDLNSPEPSTAEIQVAVADVTCKQSTDLINTWFAVETSLQKTLIASNQLALQQEETELNNAVKRASVLTG
jgi:hypothetical protein